MKIKVRIELTVDTLTTTDGKKVVDSLRDTLSDHRWGKVAFCQTLDGDEVFIEPLDGVTVTTLGRIGRIGGRTMSDFPDLGQNSDYWAYNQPGWKPCCVRCQRRKDGCKKFNSQDLGTFAGDWICGECVREGDQKTPAQKVIDRE